MLVNSSTSWPLVDEPCSALPQPSAPQELEKGISLADAYVQVPCPGGLARFNKTRVVQWFSKFSISISFCLPTSLHHVFGDL